MKPEHTAWTSKAAPRVMPMRAWSMVATDGKGLVGRGGGADDEIEVVGRRRPLAPAPRAPPRSARSEVFSPGAAMWRSRIPVRVRIHSSLVSTRLGEFRIGDDVLRADTRRNR